MRPATSLQQISVLGLGQVGLPTASLLAMCAHNVVGYDVDPEKLKALRSGDGNWDAEPGLGDLVRQALRAGRLEVTGRLEPADAFIISVPTPLNRRSKHADLREVSAAARQIAAVLRPGNLVVLESTVPPGTTCTVVVSHLERSGLRVGRDFLLAHCPERAVPGRTLYELVHNDRVIGGFDRASAELARQLYTGFVQGEIFLTDATTAEMVKLMENTARDIAIAIANEFSLLAVEHGVNVWHAIELANRHPRVKILQPGPGVGGHCIAVDPWFLAQRSRSARLILTARAINDQMPGVVARMIRSAVHGIRRPTITILGVTYKGNVADTRESPALSLIARLAPGWQVRCHDPYAQRFSHALLPLESAVRGSDCLVIVADHEEYRKLDVFQLAAMMRHAILVDTRNHVNRQTWEEAGFLVYTLGIPNRSARVADTAAIKRRRLR